MIRGVLMAVIAAWALMLAPAASAQGAPPESEDGRYSFHRTDDGYLRLDIRTGQVALCTRRSFGWACQTVPDERSALEAEIARLQGENAALKKELLARNIPLPGTVRSDPPGAKQDSQIQLPSEADMKKVVDFIEKVWRRMVEIIVNLQRDVLKKT
jgi:hypothetical protein